MQVISTSFKYELLEHSTKKIELSFVVAVKENDSISQSAPSSANVLVIKDLYRRTSVISAEAEEGDKIEKVKARRTKINLFLAQ